MITIEVIGLAGAGKSTVTDAMFGSVKHAAASYRLNKTRSMLRFALGILRGLPLVLLHGKTRLGFKHWYLLGHFEASVHDLCSRYQSVGHEVQILDQGPVFEFVSIKRYLLSGGYGKYLERVYIGLLKRFFASMDAIVYLQAPDAVLLERVMARSSGHLLKDMSPGAQRQQMTYYREEYERIFLEARDATVKLITLDTSIYRENEMLDATLDALSKSGVVLIKSDANGD